MQAIYEAILLLPHSPNQATKRLMRIHNNNPDFLFHLKTMAVQLYNRQQPITLEERSQYEIMSRQLVVLFNRFVNIVFNQRGKDIYLQVENIYQWIIDILICQKISLASKKILQSSLMLVINAFTFKSDRLVGLLEKIISISLPMASSIFVYFSALLESNVYDSQKIKTIEIVYHHLYYISNFQYQRMIEYYKDEYMENQNQTNIHNLNFAHKLKENQFILSTIWNLIKFVYQKILDKHQSQNKHLHSLINLLLLDPQLAKYLSSILKIEKDLFTSDHQNLFGLKIIVISNLKIEEKKSINRLKSLCLSTLSLILSITDKNFNLQHTDKLLMKELPTLANLILQQLFICSDPRVMQSLCQQIQICRIIACMFDLLTQIVQFYDLKKGFERLKIEQIIRLTLPYMKTYEDQAQTYEKDAEDYFLFVAYICSQQIKQETDLEIGDLFLKKNVALFLKKISKAIEGFYSILMEILLDIIRLENECRPSRNHEYQRMFLQKYNLQPNIFQCFDLESTLFIFTVLIASFDGQLENRKRIKALLQSINLRNLKQLQLYRVYTCLTKTSFFNLPEIQVKYYYYIENAFSLDRMSASINKIAFHFIEQLLIGNLDPDRNYLFFMEKIIDESLCVLQSANRPFIYSMLNSVVDFDKARKYIFNLNLINRFIQKLNTKIKTSYNIQHLNEDQIKIIFMLYLSIIKLASEFIETNIQHPYPQFQQDHSYYQQLTSELASPIILATNISILKQEILSEVQIQLIHCHCTLILHYLRSASAINQHIMTQICDYGMLLLLNDRRCFQYSNMQIKYNTLNNITFQLIYQIINTRIFSFSEEHYKTILQWMNTTYYRSQTSLNQVCIILQQFYYLISANIFRSQQLLPFFSGIAEKLQKKFFQILFNLSNYMAIVQQQLDNDRKKIHELKIQFETDVTIKYQPITICRLYGTAILNPNFDVKLISKIYQPMRKYMFEFLPSYDLTIQTLGLQFLVSRSQNIGVAECFRFTTELLYYNTKHSQNANNQKHSNKIIQMMSSELKSSIASLDPYQVYCDIIDRLIRQRETYLNDYSKPLQQFEIDLIDFIKSDKYMEDVVRRLTLVRRVNEQPRTILKIKRNQ